MFGPPVIVLLHNNVRYVMFLILSWLHSCVAACYTSCLGVNLGVVREFACSASLVGDNIFLTPLTSSRLLVFV